MPILKRLTVGPLMENCYVLADERTREAVLVDPGDEAPRLLAALDADGLTLREVWLTHAHFDHVGGLAGVLEARPVPVRMHPADRPLLERAADAAARWLIEIPAPPTDTLDLADGERLRLGRLEVEVVFTPGHAPGHVAFWLEETGAVLAGDALFQGSIGRTDLPLADGPTLLRSIRERLLALPDETVVWPGHGPETTIGAERRENPFLS